MTLKLLVADDSATIQKIVALAFSSEDAVVECISNGDTALESIRSFKPDVVLADVFMPGCSGYEICARIKEDEELAHIPVVLLSGTFEPFDEMEAFRIKSDGHLTKPFDTSELIETVLSLAQNRTTVGESDRSVEVPVMDIQTKPVSGSEIRQPEPRGPVSLQVWDSYTGSDRILDLFDDDTVSAAQAARTKKFSPKTIASAPSSRKVKLPDVTLSENMLNLVVDKVMRHMSTDIIREVAWEVVPELSEIIIRRAIEEQNKS
ncbi:MAG: response regulator [Acidobacteria bacterium]|nr:response regulator [Acidobacteriota bacterium]